MFRLLFALYNQCSIKDNPRRQDMADILRVGVRANSMDDISSSAICAGSLTPCSAGSLTPCNPGKVAQEKRVIRRLGECHGVLFC